MTEKSPGGSSVGNGAIHWGSATATKRKSEVTNRLLYCCVWPRSVQLTPAMPAAAQGPEVAALLQRLNEELMPELVKVVVQQP